MTPFTPEEFSMSCFSFFISMEVCSFHPSSWKHSPYSRLWSLFSKWGLPIASVEFLRFSPRWLRQGCNSQVAQRGRTSGCLVRPQPHSSHSPWSLASWMHSTAQFSSIFPSCRGPETPLYAVLCAFPHKHQLFHYLITYHLWALKWTLCSA